MATKQKIYMAALDLADTAFRQALETDEWAVLGRTEIE